MVPDYDLKADESVKNALKELAGFVNTATYQKFKTSAGDRSDSPSFGGSLWTEARLLGEKYKPEHDTAFDGAQKLVDKISGLADIAGQIYDAYANTQKSVEERAAELSKALDTNLPKLTADLQDQPAVPGGHP